MTAPEYGPPERPDWLELFGMAGELADQADREAAAEGLVKKMTLEGATRGEVLAARDEVRRLGLMSMGKFDAAAADGRQARKDSRPARVMLARPDGPARVLAMAQDGWAYSLGDDGYELGLWRRDRSGEWRKVAALPHCHARIVRRDGSDRRNGTDYLLSADLGGPRLVISDEKLRTGRAAGELGMTLSHDRRVLEAWATAIDDLAYLPEVGELEAIPRTLPDRSVSVPVPECLPAGYLAVSPLARHEALGRWRDVVLPAAEENPALADALGASAAGLFLEALGIQSHIVELVDDPDKGKTTVLRLAASIWGDPRGDRGTFRAWNMSEGGPLRYLGMLGILPAFVDESGMADFAPSQWAKTIYRITSGLSRLTPERDGQGMRLGLPWTSIMLITGNGSITHGLGAGKTAGIPKRVVCSGGPYTSSAAQARELKEVAHDAYGHIAAEILAAFTPEDALTIYKAVRKAEAEPGVPLVGLPEGGNPLTWAEELHAHVIGARMLDLILGTGTRLRDAAAVFARAYLAEHGFNPLHDADRLLNAVLESLARDPALWPTVREYRETRLARETMDGRSVPAETPLPQHGVARLELAGVRADVGTWVAMFPTPMHELAARLGITEGRALGELHKRGVLKVAPACRAEGDWQTFVRLQPKPARATRMYRLELPPADADAEAELEGGAEGELPPAELEAAKLEAARIGAEEAADAEAEHGPAAPEAADTPAFFSHARVDEQADSPETPETPQVDGLNAPETPPETHPRPHPRPPAEIAAATPPEGAGGSRAGNGRATTAARCAVCDRPLHPALAALGDTTHPCCDPGLPLSAAELAAAGWPAELAEDAPAEAGQAPAAAASATRAPSSPPMVEAADRSPGWAFACLDAEGRAHGPDGEVTDLPPGRLEALEGLTAARGGMGELAELGLELTGRRHGRGVLYVPPAVREALGLPPELGELKVGEALAHPFAEVDPARWDVWPAGLSAWPTVYRRPESLHEGVDVAFPEYLRPVRGDGPQLGELTAPELAAALTLIWRATCQPGGSAAGSVHYHRSPPATMRRLLEASARRSRLGEVPEARVMPPPFTAEGRKARSAIRAPGSHVGPPAEVPPGWVIARADVRSAYLSAAIGTDFAVGEYEHLTPGRLSKAPGVHLVRVPAEAAVIHPALVPWFPAPKPRQREVWAWLDTLAARWLDDRGVPLELSMSWVAARGRVFDGPMRRLGDVRDRLKAAPGRPAAAAAMIVTAMYQHTLGGYLASESSESWDRAGDWLLAPDWWLTIRAQCEVRRQRALWPAVSSGAVILLACDAIDAAYLAAPSVEALEAMRTAGGRPVIRDGRGGFRLEAVAEVTPALAAELAAPAGNRRLAAIKDALAAAEAGSDDRK